MGVYPNGPPDAPAILPPVPEGTPPELRDRAQWLCWRGEWDEEHQKLKKEPLQANGHFRASSTNAATWTTFDRALAAYNENPGLHGIGFAGLERTPYCGIDLDGCINHATGEVAHKAREIVARFGSYTELTPSGDGLRVWVEAEKPTGAWSKNRAEGIEVYDQGRFFTVTGRRLDGAPGRIQPRQPELEAFLKAHAPVIDRPRREKAEYMGNGERLALDEFLERHGVEALKALNDGASERAYAIVCPWVGEHSGGDVSGTRVGQYPSGALWFTCEHTHGEGLAWEDFREHYEPRAYERNGGRGGTSAPPTGPDSFHLTDLGNAERLVHRHSSNLRYCHPWNKWLIWDGRRWKVDVAGEAERMAVETVRSIYAEAANASDPDERKRIARHAERSEARARVDAMLALARSLPDIPVQPEDLDSDRWVLNARNGSLDLRTGELRPHRREDLITKLAPVEYDPEAQAPRFERFMSEVLVDEDVVAFVQRFAGYSLTGSTSERVMAILWGGGKNGKSTLVELLRDVLGDYARNTDTETILRKRYAGVGNDVAALKGARFVSAAEVEQGRALAESKVKNLTGSDTVTARFLFAEPFDFRPEFKLWLSTNNKPVVRGTDDAIWDRIRLIPFTRRFKGQDADPRLPEKLRTELPGVFAWMVSGCLEWQRSGLGAPEKVVAATEGYRAEMDTLIEFIDECCIVKPGVWCLFGDLYAAYDEWCRDSHEEAESKRRFADRLTRHGFEGDTGAKGVKIRKGIALRHNGNPDPSRVTDPGPQTDPKAPDNPSEGGKNGNRVTDRAENGNAQNTRKSGDLGDRVTDVTEKTNTFEVNSLREEGFWKIGNFGNSVTPEASTTGSRLTPEQVDQAKRLCATGATKSMAEARAMVLGENAPATTEDDFE